MKLKNLDIRKLFALKGFSVLIIPDNTDSNSRTHRFSYRKTITILLSYSIIVAFIGFILFSITPVKHLFFPGGNLNKAEIKSVNELNERMINLSKELDALKNTNEKLKNAMKLGDSTIFSKGSSSDYIKNKSGGSVLAIFRELLIKLKIFQKESISFIRPSEGYISRNFDPEKGHMGVDFIVKTGSPVYVSANGFVIFANYTVKDGNMIIISHPGNYISVYKHCSLLLKREREIVVQGELIALSGNTGEMTTGPHLHFEIWKDGIPINPIKILIKL
ncbi:MAG: M23 family metallopeptidase [Ignavibacteriaceae bacterium]|nr:M23 family metallopeptidase [Ignavibacteriaceae bacterium]